MSGRRPIRAAALLAPAALLAAACFYEPPRELPSSVRVLYSKAVQDSMGDRTDIYFLVARSGNELRLTGDDGADTGPTFARGRLRVYFHREASGRHEIWSMEFDGSDQRAVLTDAEAELREPAASPDAATIAYTRISGGRPAVWLADADGGNARLLADGYRAPAWSPDGGRLAVVGGEGGATRISVVDVGGGTPRALSPAAGAAQSEPAWSPDGARIAFRSGAGASSEIAVAQVAGGAITRLSDNEAEDGQPAWSPEGDRIVFVSRRPDNRWNLWIMDADGSDVRALTRSARADAADPEWL